MRDWKALVRSRIAARQLDPTRHEGVIEELAQHLDDRFRSLIAGGASEPEADRNVLLELDEGDALDQELRRAERADPVDLPVLGDGPRANVLQSFGQDIRYAARALWKSPGFSFVAALTLALGIGANTAIFSTVNAVILRPLPFRQPDRLVRIWETNIERGWPTFSTSQANFLDWRARATFFDAIAATGGESFTLTSDQGAEFVRGNAVSRDFLSVLGQSPVVGRNFLEDEDRPGANARVVILTDGFWKRQFGADPAIVGRSVALDGATYSVIGVLPPSFRWGTAELFVPLGADPAENRMDHQLTTIARLKDGATLEQAQSELKTIAAALGEQFPVSNKGWSVSVVPFYDWLIPEATRQSLQILFGAVATLLLIGCANVASLLLARGAARQKEVSIRVALGAARWRIVRQLLAESLLLSLVACGLGIAIGGATTRLLIAYGPASVPRLDEANIDVSVVLFAVSISVATVLAFGLVPALQASRQLPAATLQDATRGSTAGASRQRLRSAITVVEVALSVALLIGAGLLLRSFWQLQQVDPGFHVAPLMTARVALPDAAYETSAAREKFFGTLLSEIRTLPGILAAAASSGLPLTPGNTSTEVQVPGLELRDGARPSASWRLVSPGYFETMGIPLRGRDHTGDLDEARRTIIISDSMARAYWPNHDPLGRTIIPLSLGNRERSIIGIAGDVRSGGLDNDPPRTVYYSTSQYWLGTMQIVWRSATDPVSHVPAIRAAVQRLDPTVAMYDVRSLNEFLSDSFGPRRFNMYLLGVFAGLAVLLSAIGLFGVMAYLVSQRTREIGVRLALGANRREIFRLILGRGLTLAVAGAAIGLGGAFWLTRVMKSLLFSVSSTDPGTFIAVPAVLIAIAMIACYVPARRAMRVDPVKALRAE